MTNYHKHIVSFILIIGGCLSALKVQAQDPYLLGKGKQSWNLDEVVEIFPDSSGSLEFEDVLLNYSEAFVPIQRIKSPQMLDAPQIWLRLAFLNQTQEADFVVSVDNWDEAHIYFHDTLGNLLVTKTGKSYPLTKRDVHLGRFLHSSLKLPPGNATIVYLRLSQTTEETLSTNQTFNFYKRIELQTQKKAQTGFFIRSLFYGFNAGVLLIIIIYKLVIFFYIRDVAYLFFILFLACLLMTIGFESGYIAWHYMADRPDESFQYYGIFISISWIFLLLFARSYLRLAEFFPGLNRYVLVLVAVQILVFILAQLQIISFLITVLVFVIVILSALYISIRSILAGFKPARYFLLADSMYLGAVALTFFTSTGVISYNFYIEPFNIGNLLQVTLFSLGLAYRFKVMQIEVKIHKAEKQKLIERQKEELEYEVKLQTKKIQSQNEEIQVQNEELFQQREEISAQRDFVESKNIELEKINNKLTNNEDILQQSFDKLSESQQKISLKNKELEEREKQIRSSINAALSIQDAIHPPPALMKELFGDYFILYRPKEIVSGDFYWAQKVNHLSILVTADCTGHGVPGALMSMIGNTVLDKVISLQKHTHPTEILEKVHLEVTKALKQQETNNNNGMDMAVLVLEEYQKGLTLARFAGAKTSMYFKYPKEKEVIDVQGSRRSIGGIQNLNVTFQTRELLLSPGTQVYMGTDGYIDQNNVKRKRFGKNKFKTRLAQISHLPMEQQKSALERTLNEHMQDTTQRDDILLLGFAV